MGYIKVVLALGTNPRSHGYNKNNLNDLMLKNVLAFEIGYLLYVDSQYPESYKSQNKQSNYTRLI